jgi:hypothetical protein
MTRIKVYYLDNLIDKRDIEEVPQVGDHIFVNCGLYLVYNRVHIYPSGEILLFVNFDSPMADQLSLILGFKNA